MYQNFNDYLVSKFNKTVEDCTVDGAIETVLPMGGGEENRIIVFYPGDMISLSAFYGSFEEKHRKAIIAFIDTYNEREDRACNLNYMNDQILVEVDEFGADDQRVIKIIDGIMELFAEGGEIATALRKLSTDAVERWTFIGKRAQVLKERACEYEQQDDHESAMECLMDVCEMYYGYKHMELIALHYQHDFEKADLAMRFPHNEEYALECLLLAIENEAEDVYEPLVARSLARKLGREDVCKKMEKIGQKRGTWENVAFAFDGSHDQMLSDIARFYRKGIGCAKSERNASYYDRLASGERQEVLKDMLADGFERVFLLMNDKFYYQIQSLSELDGLSEEFKSRFLYGDEVGECKLTPWFVPLINGLNEEDRNIVLAEAKEKMQIDLDELFKGVKSGEIEVVMPADEVGGVLFEIAENWRYIYPVDLTELVECEGKTALQNVLDNLKKFN